MFKSSVIICGAGFILANFGVFTVFKAAGALLTILGALGAYWNLPWRNK